MRNLRKIGLIIALVFVAQSALAKEYAWDREFVNKTWLSTCQDLECMGYQLSEFFLEMDMEVKGLGKITVNEGYSRIIPGPYVPCSIPSRAVTGWTHVNPVGGNHTLVLDFADGSSIILEANNEQSTVCGFLNILDEDGNKYEDGFWHMVFDVIQGTGKFEGVTGTLVEEVYFKRIPVTNRFRYSLSRNSATGVLTID